jgi:HNH endonuclease
MPRRKSYRELTGQRFGRWTVLGYSHTDKVSGKIFSHCRCECGNEKTISSSSLIFSGSASCGCLRIESINRVLRIPVIDRLHKHSSTTEDGCWVWNGERTNYGYGVMEIWANGKKKRLMAHRLSFKHFHPDWDLSSFVLHKCDNPPCWNPDHLFSGTQADNMRDMVQKGRSVKGRKRSPNWLDQSEPLSKVASLKEAIP